jgi:hypothetical protein
MKIKKKIVKAFYDMERDGITQSMISMWLTCREKARLYIQGWDSKYHSPALTYGTIGHSALELAYLDMQAGKLKAPPTKSETRRYILQTEKRWHAENVKPNVEALQYLETSLALMEVTLPRYFDYWKQDFKQIEWVSLEKKFKVYMTLQLKNPNRLFAIPVRGKRDGELRLGKGLWLFETKFKSMINEGDLVETLSFETQVLLYIWALWMENDKKEIPKGVRYNIVRRTALRQGANESTATFAKRVAADMDKRLDFYFLRMESAITLPELVKFETELKGIVQDMYEWHKGILPHYKNTYSCLGKYGKCSMLGACSRDDYSALVKRKTMFKELEDF